MYRSSFFFFFLNLVYEIKSWKNAPHNVSEPKVNNYGKSWMSVHAVKVMDSEEVLKEL